ncbi:MAG: GAF domain-containing protein, partial [Flavobacteriales bacterium]
ENKKSVFINDLKTDYKEYISNYREDENRELEDGSYSKTPSSIIYLPILVQNKVLGLITVQSYDKNAYTQRHLEILNSIGSYAGVAIENASAYKQLSEAHEELEKLSLVASKTDNTVIICDSNFEMEWANESFKKTQGCDLEEFKQKNQREPSYKKRPR